MKVSYCGVCIGLMSINLKKIVEMNPKVLEYKRARAAGVHCNFLRCVGRENELPSGSSAPILLNSDSIQRRHIYEGTSAAWQNG